MMTTWIGAVLLWLGGYLMGRHMGRAIGYAEGVEEAKEILLQAQQTLALCRQHTREAKKTSEQTRAELRALQAQNHGGAR